MEETKEVKKKERKVKNEGKSKKAKHKGKATIGDIIFRVLILVAVFFIVLIAYVFYLQKINDNRTDLNNTTNKVVTRTIKSSK